MLAGPVPGVLGATARAVSQLPDGLPNAARLDPWTEANHEAWMFTVPGVARYLIRGGTMIDVVAEPGADPRSVELFLHGSARGFLIHQRRELPLEAVTLAAPQGGAVALAGPSGTGKSTLAAELCRRGWRLIAEDITRVTTTGGRSLAWPSHTALKLWRDACETLGISTDQLVPVRERMEKFHVQMPASSRPEVLRYVIRLEMRPEGGLIEISPNRRSALLSECTFRRLQMDALGRQSDLARIVGQIAAGIRMMALNGAREESSAILAEHIVGKIS